MSSQGTNSSSKRAPPLSGGGGGGSTNKTSSNEPKEKLPRLPPDSAFWRSASSSKVIPSTAGLRRTDNLAGASSARENPETSPQNERAVEGGGQLREEMEEDALFREAADLVRQGFKDAEVQAALARRNAQDADGSNGNGKGNSQRGRSGG